MEPSYYNDPQAICPPHIKITGPYYRQMACRSDPITIDYYRDADGIARIALIVVQDILGFHESWIRKILIKNGGVQTVHYKNRTYFAITDIIRFLEIRGRPEEAHHIQALREKETTV